MKHVNISVVIPTYRRIALLRKCLDAIALQECPDCSFEVIVVSDGPDEKSEFLVDLVKNEYRHLQITFHALEQKRGPAAARNYGWKQSAGELIVFTDDDCLPSPVWLAGYWQSYQSDKRLLAAYTGKVDVPVPEKPTDYEKNVSHLSTAEFITANCACTKTTLEQVGGFDEDFPVAWREDSDLQFRLLEKQVPIVNVSQALICHPVRKSSWGSSIRDQRKSMFNALLYKKHPHFYRSKIAGSPVWNYYAVIFSSITAIAALLIQNHIVAIIGLLVWLYVTVKFMLHRMAGTDASFSHRLEMVLTSLLIPYLSVYWTLRGALCYKVFFL